MQVGPLPVGDDVTVTELYAPGEIPFVKRPVDDIAEYSAIVRPPASSALRCACSLSTRTQYELHTSYHNEPKINHEMM